MEPRDRRLLVWIAVSTTFIAAVVAVALVWSVVVFVLATTGRHHDTVIEPGTTIEIRTTP